MSNEIEHICNGQSDGQHGRAGHGGRQMQSYWASESCKSARASEPSATSSSACMHIAGKIETCVPRMEQKGMSAQNKPRHCGDKRKDTIQALPAGALERAWHTAIRVSNPEWVPYKVRLEEGRSEPGVCKHLARRLCYITKGASQTQGSSTRMGTATSETTILTDMIQTWHACLHL